MGLTETLNSTAETKFQVTSYLLFLLKDKKKCSYYSTCSESIKSKASQTCWLVTKLSNGTLLVWVWFRPTHPIIPNKEM